MRPTEPDTHVIIHDYSTEFEFGEANMNGIFSLVFNEKLYLLTLGQGYRLLMIFVLYGVLNLNDGQIKCDEKQIKLI